MHTQEILRQLQKRIAHRANAITDVNQIIVDHFAETRDEHLEYKMLRKFLAEQQKLDKELYSFVVSTRRENAFGNKLLSIVLNSDKVE
jgi:hypothetical protein